MAVLITSTGASTRIEGARLTDENIEKLMRGISIQKFRDRDVQEVKGYYELLTNVFDSWQTLRLSEGLIKSFHKELLKYGDKDVLHRTASSMQDLVEWTQARLVARATVKQALIKIQDIGKIEMLGIGRGARYRKK